MNSKQRVRLALLILAVPSVSAFVWMQSVTAQQGGDGGYGGAGASGFGTTGTGAYDGTGGIGGAGGAGGGGGYGGAGGAGGGGGGGGMLLPSTDSRLAAFGDYVYVLRHGRLYQYAAYDLALVKKINVSDAVANKRSDRRRENGGGRGADGGAGGDGADGANGGQGGAGGFGGGFAFMQAASSEDVAAAGDFVYVLQGDKLHKLAADGLTSIKSATLKFDE